MLPFADTDEMNDHLAEISRTVTPGAHAALVLDKAGWYRAGALAVPDNISLVLLPSDSPELNPVENVWQYRRANWLAISVFDDYDAIVDACCDAWTRFAEQNRPRLLNNLPAMGKAQEVSRLNAPSDRVMTGRNAYQTTGARPTRRGVEEKPAAASTAVDRTQSWNSPTIADRGCRVTR